MELTKAALKAITYLGDSFFMGVNLGSYMGSNSALRVVFETFNFERFLGPDARDSCFAHARKVQES